MSGQIGNVQFSHITSSPIKAIAKDDFPDPVGPTMTIWGRGKVRFDVVRSEAVTELQNVHSMKKEARKTIMLIKSDM